MGMVFAIHQHELFTGICMCPHPETPSHLPPHPIPLGCPREPALGALLHASNFHWPSVLHMVMNTAQCFSLKTSHPYPSPTESKSLFSASVFPLWPCVCLSKFHRYELIYSVCLSLSDFTLYYRLQFHLPH